MISSAIWIIKGFVKTVAQVFGITVFSSIFSLSLLPLGAEIYNKANKSNRVGYLVMRELFVCLGRIIILAFMMIAGNFLAGFVFTGIAKLLYFLI